MSDPFGLMQFAECEHKQLKCEKCGARSDIRGWSTFTGQNKEMMELREEIDSLTARLAAANVEIERLQKALIPSWYWDDRDLESAIPADEVCDFDDVGDIIELRPIVELPTVFALVTEDGVEFYDSFDAANESEPDEAANGGRDGRT